MTSQMPSPPSSPNRPPRRWLPPAAVNGHRLPAGLPAAAVQLLLSRGIGSAAELERFLNPKGLPHSPGLLAGMAEALPRLARAVRAGERVAVFGDFDVDGMTGTAILCDTLSALGAQVIPYLPHPVREGHGVSAAAVERLAAQGATLIVTVDCGISDAAAVALAAKRGMDAVITDHHTPPAGERPDAVAIVNPRMPGSRYPCPELCGAGIAYKVASALRDYLGEPPDRSLLELAALGTVADLVPLRDENRYLVQQGLGELPDTRRPGLRALLRRLGLYEDIIRSEDVAFRIAPRLNAAGRMDDAATALALLLTRDAGEGERLTAQLEDYNNQRRELTATACEAAIAETAAISPLPAIIITHRSEYKPGINGLVTARLSEIFHRPAVALAATGDGEELVASARSSGDFNLIEAIAGCADLLVRYGGHAAAAGFTVRREMLPAVSERLLGIAGAAMGLLAPEPTLEIHAEGPLDELLSPTMARLCQQLEPFGKSNPTPRYLTRRAEVRRWGYVGRDRQHLKLVVSSGGGREIDALSWNYPPGWGGYERVDLVFRLAQDRRGRQLRQYLKIEDLRPAA